MKYLDFLSSSPSIYFLKERRGKNKLGGFFSIIFTLVMVALIIYYLYMYLFGLEYNLTYYRDNWTTYLNNEQKEALKQEKPFFFHITDNPNNAKIAPYLLNSDLVLRRAQKCETNPDPNFFSDEVYCFNLSFYPFRESKNYSLYLLCEENCTLPNGEPADITTGLFTTNLKINHTNEEPLMEMKNFFIGNSIHLITDNSKDHYFTYEFTPILYYSSAVLNTKIKSYFNSYYSDAEEILLDSKNYGFARFYIILNNDCDIYIREFRTLLDSLSKIGGLFSPLKLLFEFLVMFYSYSEMDSEIAKNVFSKIKNYEYNQINISPIEKNENNFIIQMPNENREIRKKLKINKVTQYFCSCFNCCRCCKTKGSMKLLNLYSEFVHDYLSAENIIYNLLLFESYYKNNPIKYNKNVYLNNIEMEIENKIISKGKERNNEEKKEGKESLFLTSISSEE